MTSTLVIPAHTFPLAPGSSQTARETAHLQFLSAALLLFESVGIQRLCLPNGIDVPTTAASNTELDTIASLAGVSDINSLDLVGYNALSHYHRTCFDHAQYERQFLTFVQRYESLIAQNAISWSSYSTITATPSPTNRSGGTGFADWFLDILPQIQWPDEGRSAEYFTPLLGEMHGLPLAAMMLRHAQDRRGREMHEFDIPEPEGMCVFTLSAMRFELLLLLFISLYSGRRLLCTSAVTLAALGDLATALAPTSLTDDAPLPAASGGTVEYLIMCELLKQLPGLVPRHPEALLALRHLVGADLAAFRDAIRQSALLLGDCADPAAITAHVHKTYAKPVSDLSHRFRSLPRALAGNIATSGSVLGMVASFAAGSALATIGATIAGVATGLIRTLVEMDRDIANAPPGVALLLAMERHPLPRRP